MVYMVAWANVGRDVKHGVCAAAQFATRAAGSVGNPEEGGRKTCSNEQGTARLFAGRPGWAQRSIAHQQIRQLQQRPRDEEILCDFVTAKSILC